MPNPSDYENQDDFISACISQRQDEHPDESNEQSVAICYSMWSEKSGKRVVHKVHADDQLGMEFVLSDATPDRYGDVILAEGWDLANFAKNPIALFNHSPDFPIGRWERLRVEKGALRGHLRLAPEGTSARIDEIRKLVEAKILRAVSVGFRPIEYEPRGGAEYGQTYKRSELVETSLVAVPANPNALSVAKSLKISDATMKMVFAKNGSTDRSIPRVDVRGKHAKTSLVGKTTKMTTPISVRIEQIQNRIVALRDDLTKHLETVDDNAPTEEQTTITEAFTQQIETQEKQLDVLKKAEAQLARASASTSTTAVNRGSEQPMIVRDPRVWAMPAKKVKPEDYIWRAAALQFKHYCQRGTKSLTDVLKASEYADDEITYHALNLITRSNVVPADTTTTGWAKELNQTLFADMIESLQPFSIYPRLRSMGQSYTFGTNGSISIPSRDATPTVAGAFVLQGAPIPVKQGAFSAITLVPHKMGVITTLTREIAEHSTPALEGILRNAILQDTAVALDTVLMGAAAGTTTQPAGMLAGVTVTTADAAGSTDLAKFQNDVTNLVAALVTGTNGNLRRPVWIMSPADVVIASMLQTTTGDMPFKDELARGTLYNIPVIQSTTGTSDKMFLLDAADFATATGDTPRFDVSDQAVLHMDTAPTQLAGNATATPVAAAYPIRSLYQTDSLAIRMIVDLTWAWTRTGTVVWTQTMGWN